LAINDRSAAHELDDLTLARAQQGEAPAFRTLVELYQDAVFALLWRFLGRRARAEIIEDVAQETFLGVYQSVARFRPDGAARLSTWILTIATRTALKAVRKTSPPMVPLDELVEILPAAEAVAGQRGFADALSRSLDALSEPHRIVFLLRAYHDFAYQEIADALDIGLGTVKSRLSRARSQLQTDLREFEP